MKKILALIFAMVVLLGTAPIVALAYDGTPYDDVVHLPPDQFTPEALLAIDYGDYTSGIGGYYSYAWSGYNDYAFWWIVPSSYDNLWWSRNKRNKP